MSISSRQQWISKSKSIVFYIIDSTQRVNTLLKKVLAAGLSFGLSASMALAEDYPSKPIEMVIGFKPGGFSDAMARKLSEPLTKATDPPIVHSHMGGACLGAFLGGLKMRLGNVLESCGNPLMFYVKMQQDYLLSLRPL